MSRSQAVKSEINGLIQKLKTERDELNLQLHLAKAEVLEEWELMEHKWHQFQSKAAQVGDATLGASKEVNEAAHLLGSEVKAGYQRIREAIKRG